MCIVSARVDEVRKTVSVTRYVGDDTSLVDLIEAVLARFMAGYGRRLQSGNFPFRLRLNLSKMAGEGH